MIQPPTTRISGGVPARFAALAVLLVFGLVAWIGVAGPRPRAPIATPSSSPTAAAVVTPQPSATPRRSPAYQPDVPLAAEQYHRQMMTARDAYAVLAAIDGRFYLVFLAEPAEGRLYGEARLPLPRRSVRGTFQLMHLWTRDPEPLPLNVMQSWRRRLPSRETLPAGGQLVLQASRDPVGAEDAPRLARAGYALTIRIVPRDGYALIVAELDY